MMANESGAISLMFMLVYLLSYVIQSTPAAAMNHHRNHLHHLSAYEINHHDHDPNQSHHQQRQQQRHHQDEQQQQQNNQANNSRPKKTAEQLPQEQKLALQILIADPSNGKKTSGIQHKRHSNILVGKKRPYDLIIGTPKSFSTDRSGIIPKSTLEKYSPFEKHYYLLDPVTESSSRDDQEFKDYRKNLFGSSSSSRVELVRTQHKPLRKRPIHIFATNNEGRDYLLPLDGGNSGKKRRFRLTTVPPTATTTEFYELISSAHSPIKNMKHSPADSMLETRKGLGNKKPTTDELIGGGGHRISAPSRFGLNSNDENRQSTLTTSTTTTSTPPPQLGPTRYITQNVTDGRVVSPEIMVNDGEEPGEEGASLYTMRGNLVRKNPNYSSPVRLESMGGSLHSERNNRPSSPMINFTLSSNEIPSTLFDGKKKVTILRRTPTRKSTTTTTEPTILEPMPDRIQIDDLPPTNITLSSLPSEPLITNQLVRLIAKHKNKYDENVRSSTLTVVDNDAIRLPPNATSVHNKLIVAIRPGRPRRYPSTTQFPVYNIVAGMTPPSSSHQQSGPTPFSRPNSPEGSVWGLLKPVGGSENSTTTPQPSTFGATNIKFPAPAPSSLQPEHIELPEKLNVTVPDIANFVLPNKVPDKLQIETDEQPNRPPDALVISDPSYVSRPHGSQVVTNNDGIQKLVTTTKRPYRPSTTKRINIVAANTTVVHQFNHNFNQTPKPSPPPKPGIISYITNLFNASVATSAVAVLTLIKTIFVAILVMFLPPIALTAAITQAIALG